MGDESYNIMMPISNQFWICFKENRTITNNLWVRSKPLTNAVPPFLVQLGVTIFVSRILMSLLKPAYQPRFICELMAGILLGPSFEPMRDIIFGGYKLNRSEGIVVLESMASLGLTYYMFVAGLEMDPTPLRNINRTTFAVTLAGIVLPLVAGAGLYSLLVDADAQYKTEGTIFWAISLTVTSFPELARILSELKLLHSDLGKTALTSALIKDIIVLVLLVGAVSTINGENNLLTMFPTMAFIVFFWAVVRPFLAWVIHRTANKKTAAEEPYGDGHVFFLLAAVLLFGFISEMCGSHPMLGAFLLGLSIPNGDLGTKIMDKMEEFVMEIMLPPIFLTTGLRTNFHFLFKHKSPLTVTLVIVLASCLKILSTILVSPFLKNSFRDGFVLGVLMNTKGVLALIILNEGRSLKGFDQQIFATIMVAILVMTALVGPVAGLLHKPSIRDKLLYSRSLERSKIAEAEFRVLACVHSLRNVNGMTNLLRNTYATIKSPVTIFVVHLVELTGLSSAMLIFHNDSNPTVSASGSNHLTRGKAEAEQIVTAFGSFSKDNDAVYVQQMTAVSPYPTMHEDIGNFALDKSVSLILVPFHNDRRQTEENPHQKEVMRNLLGSSPCSVGIIIDRASAASSFDAERKYKIAVFFVGGPDYREALAYGWRAAKASRVSVTVVRFLSGKDLEDCLSDDSDQILSALMELEKDRQQDEDYVNEFRFRTMYDKSITYVEKQVNSVDEIFMAIRSSFTGFDLYVVGRGQGLRSPLMMGLSEWSDYPELGPIGEALFSSDYAEESSILVLQQPHQEKDRTGAAGGDNMQFTGETFVNHRKKNDDDS